MAASMKAVLLMAIVGACSGTSTRQVMDHMQLTSHLAFAQGVSKSQHQGQLLAQLQSQLINLANQSSSNTSELAPFVTSIRALLNSTVKPNVLTRLSNKQNLLNVTYQQYFNCSIDIEPVDDSPLQILADNHTDCRNREIESYTDWTDCLNQSNSSAALMNQTCGNYNQLNQFPDPQLCNTVGLTPKLDHLIDEATRFQNLLGNLTAANQSCNNATDEHNAIVQQCIALENTYNGIKKNCSSAQQALENCACNYTDVSECGPYNTCWDGANISYANHSNWILIEQEELRKEWESILRIECYLDAFTATDKSAAIITCITKTYNLSAVTATIYPIPDKHNCTEIPDPQHVPGTWAFQDDWYSEISDLSMLDDCRADCCSNQTIDLTQATTTTTTTTTCTEWVKKGQIRSDPPNEEYPGGSWYSAFCDDLGPVIGAKQKVDKTAALTDDTGLNGVELKCKDGSTPSAKVHTPGWPNNGDWSGQENCAGNATMVGYRVKNSEHIGRRRRWTLQNVGHDNMALTGIKFKCSDGQTHGFSNTLSQDWWGAWETCPQDQWVCGLHVKENEGLGDMKLQCCGGQTTTCTGNWKQTLLVESKGRTDGNWGSWDECSQRGKIFGFRQKVENRKGAGDDTAMNAVEFKCPVGTVTSQTSQWGNWGGWTECPTGEHIVAFRMKSEPSQQWFGDDTSVNAIRARCSDGTVLKANNEGPWGQWSVWAECPPDGWFCGVNTKVQGGGGLLQDDFALSDIKIRCCGTFS